MKYKQWPRVRFNKQSGGYSIDCGKRLTGKRHVENRGTLEEANARAAEIRLEHDQIGAAAISLTADQKLSAVRAWKRLGPGITLDAVVDFWMLNKGIVDHSCTVAQVQAELLDVQKQKGLRPESITGTRTRYASFVEQHSEKPISEIRYEDVAAWLRDRAGDCQNTIGNRIRYLNVFFQYALKHGYININPMSRVERPRKQYKVPEFLSAIEVRHLLEAAEEHDEDMAAKFAIGFFAGIRPEEMNKLDWSDLKTDGSDPIITIRPEVAKCGIPRHVAIQPNLLEWIMAYRKPSGCVGLKTKAFSVHRRELMKMAGVAHWPHDAMRHTFATMHLAAFEDAAKTALELGHTQGVRLLYTNYRGLTTKANASDYWAIRPGRASAANQIVEIRGAS